MKVQEITIKVFRWNCLILIRENLIHWSFPHRKGLPMYFIHIFFSTKSCCVLQLKVISQLYSHHTCSHFPSFLKEENFLTGANVGEHKLIKVNKMKYTVHKIILSLYVYNWLRLTSLYVWRDFCTLPTTEHLSCMRISLKAVLPWLSAYTLYGMLL